MATHGLLFVFRLTNEFVILGIDASKLTDVSVDAIFEVGGAGQHIVNFIELTLGSHLDLQQILTAD